MVKYIKGRNTPIKDLEGGVNIDSDCEAASRVLIDTTLEKAKEEETRAVLIAGSFSAYV